MGKKPVPVKRIDMQTGEAKLYISISDAARDNYTETIGISKAARGEYKQYIGYRWERVAVAN